MDPLDDGAAVRVVHDPAGVLEAEREKPGIRRVARAGAEGVAEKGGEASRFPGRGGWGWSEVGLGPRPEGRRVGHEHVPHDLRGRAEGGLSGRGAR